MADPLDAEQPSEPGTRPPGPRLVAVAGPLEGRSFPLGSAGLSLGRQSSNDLALPDPAASRRHCRVELRGGRFLLRDLGSLHSTLVNGLPVREQMLEPGDQITVGSSVFLFAMDVEDGAGEETGAILVEGNPRAGSTTRFAAEEGGYLRPEGLAAALPEARAAHDLQALLRIGQELHALHASGPLARRLLELALDTVPAERASVLLVDARTGELAASHGVDRKGPAEPFPISRTLMERVVAERSAVLANDVLQPGGPWGGVRSVASALIQSLVAVPLVSPEGVVGVLYVDTLAAGVRFDTRHVEVLSAAAGIAGAALVNLRRLEGLREENRRLEASLDPGMVGDSPPMREVYRQLGRIAPTDSTVLLRGESGTGKEMAARALHRGSPRAGKPFMAINCATLSETLLESELFGHEKGAFTGAVVRRTGKLEAAEGGTLFLDEVGELPLALQAKLLRVLQEREYERLGSSRPIRVNVRLVAATNRNLEQAIRAGTFRDDLFYRLNVISLTLPPLRERRQDVLQLALHFAALDSRKIGRRVTGFTPEARACLLRYDWPGNVRELANAVERAIVLGDGELIRPEDLPETVLETAPPERSSGPVGAYHGSVNDFKKQLLFEAIAAADGNVAQAAAQLELNPTYLHRLIRNLGVKGQFIRKDKGSDPIG
jgi:transcriptional regulator with GAF, ATPase, and Fis domain